MRPTLIKKYPKLLALLLTIGLAAIFFNLAKSNLAIHDYIISLGYPGIFIAGIFYAYGFTATPATAVLLILAKSSGLLISGLIGGLGALVSDVIIFLLVKQTFMLEIERLKGEKAIRLMIRIGNDVFKTTYKYLLPVVAGFLIASPLPTEIGVSMLASRRSLTIKKFIPVALGLHTLGIFLVLWIGKTI